MNNKRHVPLVEGAGLLHLGPSGRCLRPQSSAHAKRLATLIIISADLRTTRYAGLESDMIEDAVLGAHKRKLRTRHLEEKPQAQGSGTSSSSDLAIQSLVLQVLSGTH
ncbi:hypothetical protein M404DRAFT_27816 [Pisolithus tinctorius Marx 270]|uniref:Uncharacterized protein n=1 Tax=Pisolithus tinctorius Marx 270 TaxID=870435 RepID=A0A0C3P523_PISTI|nr:hypothetical protein M404DRAFT_27816 [Pisolithus tinctorius Marx 270]